MNSPKLSMEALCLLVKIIKIIIAVIPVKAKNSLRATVPILSSCLSISYPQINKGELEFDAPSMITSELWKDINNNVGRASLLKDAKELIEELNPIKPEVLSSAVSSMKSVSQKADDWIENKDLARLRIEKHQILLKNNGYQPDEKDAELFKKYNNIVARIKKLEEERHTILGDIDTEYEKLIKKGLI